MDRRSFDALLAASVAGCTDAIENPDRRGSETTAGGTKTERPTETTATETATATPRPDAAEIEIDGVVAKREPYELREVPYEERPQFIHDDRREPQECRYNADQVDELPNVVEANIGGEEGLMPLRTSRLAMGLLHCYREIEREPYLEKAIEIGDAFLDTATTVDGGIPYFPYTMDKGGSGVQLEAPWYSGMAQGTSLSAYLRLYETTGEERYVDVADDVFRSFTRLKRSAADGEPWTAMVDDGYYWIEEYPHDPPTHVLNGFNVGLWGIYEHWLLTKDEFSEALVQAAITTVADHIEEYREPGEVSWYGLNRGYRGNEFYHAVHIHQLRQLHAITGDEYFEEMRRTFEEDNPEEEGLP
ncbi:D-glucuronyl C5-epimerase family protein [Halegenticoccus tardaugens]|uniref:D-glucuronyl C5-epimerase family protein n=1 Tax=Halegenticoccus tardaugens TaxID=2071624 RepID=UPI00100A477D|nr:D-glucuronyl C5-epimerase family protein [Halegenticoccus tardaugens]